MNDACPRNSMKRPTGWIERQAAEGSSSSFPYPREILFLPSPLFAAPQARRQTAIYITPIINPPIPPVPAPISDSRLKAQSVLT